MEQNDQSKKRYLYSSESISNLFSGDRTHSSFKSKLCSHCQLHHSQPIRTSAQMPLPFFYSYEQRASFFRTLTFRLKQRNFFLKNIYTGFVSLLKASGRGHWTQQLPVTTTYTALVKVTVDSGQRHNPQLFPVIDSVTATIEGTVSPSSAPGQTTCSDLRFVCDCAYFFYLFIYFLFLSRPLSLSRALDCPVLSGWLSHALHSGERSSTGRGRREIEWRTRFCSSSWFVVLLFKAHAYVIVCVLHCLPN